jgi:hypothetical protein
LFLLVVIHSPNTSFLKNIIIMNINELKRLIRTFINDCYYVPINHEMIFADNGLRTFNALIRDEVQDLAGVYIWENNDNNEVLYIGMAGKVNQQGMLVNHSIRNRLQASRGKDTETGKDILTNRYIRYLMAHENSSQLNIHVIHLQDGQIPGYIEAVLINEFYQRNGILPRYNHMF